MSGGSYDYLCFKIEEAAEKIAKECRGVDTYHRHKFSQLLKLVAKAMHDIEWVDSCDYGPKDENEAIEECFKFVVGEKNLEIFHQKEEIYNKIKALVEEFLK